ncbi:MAG: glycerol-3-phosphate 1-O-acyltransferase PlsY [Bacillota bacterium]|nr:glycerol-3-phosphate 1-O-acyltransferase PlsY [Bacillota bacterium]
MLNFLIVILISYLLGAIPFAYIMTRLLTGKDVREYGSGNVGATNAGRLLGFKYGFLVALLDVLKAILAVSIARSLLSPELARYYLLIAASFVIIGHNWSVFLRFMGGKGVATTCGVIFTLFPLGFIIFFIIWLIVLLLSRYVSLASIISGACLPLIIYFLKGDIYDLIFALIFALLIILRHRTNIIRLLNKTEDKIRWPLINRKGDL